MNWSKVKIKDLLNPRKWWIVIDAYWRKSRGVTLENCQTAIQMKYTSGLAASDFWCRMVMKQDLEFAEMVVDRASRCPDCVEEGSCVHCGCTSPENMYSPLNSCSAGNWGPKQ